MAYLNSDRQYTPIEVIIQVQQFMALSKLGMQTSFETRAAAVLLILSHVVPKFCNNTLLFFPPTKILFTAPLLPPPL